MIDNIRQFVLQDITKFRSIRITRVNKFKYFLLYIRFLSSLLHGIFRNGNFIMKIRNPYTNRIYDRLLPMTILESSAKAFAPPSCRPAIFTAPSVQYVRTKNAAAAVATTTGPSSFRHTRLERARVAQQSPLARARAFGPRSAYYGFLLLLFFFLLRARPSHSILRF